MLIKDKNNRVAIYFFYDGQGIVDRYVEYFLEDFSQYVRTLYIVSNGNLEEAQKQKLQRFGEVIERENKGFDVWAYKTTLEKIGWEKLSEYEEVVLLNSTIMGPVDSFEKTFKTMDEKDLDFWGMTIYPKYNHDPFNCISYGYIPEHLQSHFIVCRRSLVTTDVFQEYWKNMPMINNYSEAIGRHEAIFTKYFSDKGFKWEAFVDTHGLEDYTGYPLMMCPTKLIKEYNCPIFKKRSFFHDINDFLRNTTGEQTSELYEYLDKHTNYDVDMIWDPILRSYDQEILVKNMNLTYVLPKEFDKNKTSNSKVALVIHMYFPDLLEENKKYIESMPKNADIYITTNTEEKKKEILKVYKDLQFNKFEVRVIENRGRDVSALLTGVKDVIMDYDIVCFAHDKKTAQIIPGTSGASFAYKCFENVLASKQYVSNVIDLFDENKRLGMLVPPEPNHGILFPTVAYGWGPNFEITKQLADKLKLTVPINAYCQPVAPYGTMFWFRPKALKLLFDCDWKYEDFPKEPNKIDGTLLHAIERIYPYVVQQEGFYPAIGMTDKFAAIEYQNLHHYTRGFVRAGVDSGLGPYYDEMILGLRHRVLGNGVKKDIKILAKDIVKTTTNLIKSALRKIMGEVAYEKYRRKWVTRVK